VGHLTEAERMLIDKQGWADEMDVPPYVPLGRSWGLNKRADGACVFLDDDGLCRIHKRFGEAGKPLACRIYPFSVRAVTSGWQASLRFDCPSVQAADGVPIREHQADLRKMLQELSWMPPSSTDNTVLVSGRKASDELVEKLLRIIERWFKREQVPILHRLMGTGRLVEALADGHVQKLADDRLLGAMELMLEAMPREGALRPDPPSPKVLGMMRQLAFAHAEHVTTEEMQAGFLGGISKRWDQLRRARQFQRGRGVVPPVPGIEGEATFEQVEAVSGVPRSDTETTDVLQRYLLVRLQGRTVCGEGYYGWSLVLGLAGLCYSVVAAGWLARLAAAAAGREVLNADDVGLGLAIVDRAATRAPSLGTTAERLRAQYMMQDDAIAGLLYKFAIVRDDAE
jgi:lysine-N-methylase